MGVRRVGGEVSIELKDSGSPSELPSSQRSQLPTFISVITGPTEKFCLLLQSGNTVKNE